MEKQPSEKTDLGGESGPRPCSGPCRPDKQVLGSYSDSVVSLSGIPGYLAQAQTLFQFHTLIAEAPTHS